MANNVSKSFLDDLLASTAGLADVLDKVELPKAKKGEETDFSETQRMEYEDWKRAHGGREPDPNASEVSERMMAYRAEGLRKKEASNKETDAKSSVDSELDRILGMMDEGPNLEDFSSAAGQMILKSQQKAEAKNKRKTKYMARRMPVKKFAEFKPMFDTVCKEIEEKKREVFSFSTVGLCPGRFYISNGLLCYIDKTFETESEAYVKNDYRIRVIFSNGTESYVLKSTFEKSMYGMGGGRAVAEPNESADDFKLVADEDKGKEKFTRPDVETGMVYALRSKTDDPEVLKYGVDFYKIGYTSGDVFDRIKNCENEPTYLCSGVYPVQTWSCINFRAKGLEKLLHKFFSKAQVEIRVNSNGKSVVATEWYNIPFSILEDAIPMFINGSIVNYYYDHKNKMIREKH